MFDGLAVIKIYKIGLFPAKFGKASDIIIGKTAIAIGTPLSFQNRNSASVGVISGLNRSIDGFYEYKLIQTDVSINQGNSGGPLVLRTRLFYGFILRLVFIVTHGIRFSI